jgi:hypothetical protein
MTRTFLVALDLEPLSDVNEIALDMLDSLAQDGFQVTSVKPWASANTDQQTGAFWNINPPQTFSGQPVL